MRMSNGMTAQGDNSVLAKIIVNSTVLEPISNFEYVGYNVSYNTNNDVVNTLHKFNHVLGTIMGQLTSEGTRLQLYKVTSFVILLYGSENVIKKVKQSQSYSNCQNKIYEARCCVHSSKAQKELRYAA